MQGRTLTFASAVLVLAALVPPLRANAAASVVDLAKECAPSIHPLTMAAVVSHESRNNSLAVNVNGNYRLPRQPATQDEAVQTVRWLTASGFNFDVGLAQINSANFARLGLTGEALLDPCANLRASAVVLTGCYAQAVRSAGEGQEALRHALSCYNTGSQTRGFANGYVQKVAAQARILQVPALLDDGGGSKKEAQTEHAGTGGQTGGKVRPAAGTPDDSADEGAFSNIDPGAFSTNPESR
jgi:type IV secretion system protein VirB1